MQPLCLVWLELPDSISLSPHLQVYLEIFKQMKNFQRKVNNCKEAVTNTDGACRTDAQILYIVTSGHNLSCSGKGNMINTQLGKQFQGLNTHLAIWRG